MRVVLTNQKRGNILNNNGEYLPIRSRGKYSPIFTEPEANNCFSVIFSGEYQESAKQRVKTREKVRKVLD